VIEWAAVKPALLELVGSLAWDDSVDPQWEHKSQVHESPTLQQSVFLRVATVVPEGAVQESYEEDEYDSTILHESTSGHSLITLEIKCDAFVNLDSAWSFQTAERIRTRLQRRSSHQTLLSLNMCLVETHAAVDGSYEVTDEEGNAVRRNMAVFDVVLRCTFNDVSPDPADYWNKVLITSAIKHAGGTSVSTPPNYAAEQVPPD